MIPRVKLRKKYQEETNCYWADITFLKKAIGTIEYVKWLEDKLTELSERQQQPSTEQKAESALRIGSVKHRFSIGNKIIETASLRIREHFICANPLTKSEQIDREIQVFLVELLNSLNGD